MTFRQRLLTIRAMTFEDVKTYFGSAAKAADALGMERQSIYRWQTEGVPELMQFKLHYVTRGVLKLDEGLLKSVAA